MQFSYNWLQSFFEKKLPLPGKLAEVLTMHSFEADVLKPVKLPSGASDIILDIDVLPNRAHDCFSHSGIAKEISVLFNLPLPLKPKPKLEIIKQEAEKYLKLEVEEPELCRRYVAGIMLGVKVGPSPTWLQERLIAIGQKPINNIVDCANYVMFEVGQPLHAFDMDKLKPVEIIVRRAKSGEGIISLDNKKYTLDSGILVIADTKQPLAIAGIKGGKYAEIDKKTKNIIIEAANFEPANIRLTSRKLNLTTGASVGFENEIPPAIASEAMERVMSLIWETAGGKIVSGKIDFYPKKFVPIRVSFKLADVSKLLGVDISEKEIVSTLNRLGFGLKKAKGALIAASPASRLDLNSKEDVIEEIARIHGYKKIPANAPEGVLIPAPRNDNYFYENIVRNILVAEGFSEVYNYSFAAAGEVEIENPIAENKKYLRTSLLPGLINNVAENFKYFGEVKIFEIGKVFGKFKNNIEEKNMLAAIAASHPPAGGPKAKAEEFYEIKGVVESLLSKLGIDDYWFGEHPAKTAEIKIGEEGIGTIEENAFELDLEKLIRLANEEIEYRPVSKYPAVIRDIAVLVPPETRVIEVLDVIENTAGPLLTDTDLFDIYEGEEVGENRKNFAFHLIFQSREKTLSDNEINVLMNKIIKALEGKEDWEVRK